MTYKISATETGFSINGEGFTWSDFKSGTDSLGDSPIKAGNYSFEYRGLTLSLTAEDNANIKDLVGRMNGASFSTEEKVTYKQMAYVKELCHSATMDPWACIFSNKNAPMPADGILKIRLERTNGTFTYEDSKGNPLSIVGVPVSVSSAGYPLRDIFSKDEVFCLDFSSLGASSFADIRFTEETSLAQFFDMIDGAEIRFDTTPDNDGVSEFYDRYQLTGMTLSPAKVASKDISLSSIKQTDYQGIEVPPAQDQQDTAPLSLWIQSGAEAGQGMWLEIDRMNTDILGLEDLDASTTNGAKHAMDAVKDALQKVSTNRSKIGAQQNRLEHTVANEENIVENTTAAESAIRDTDMAGEMMRFSKDNILEQVGQAMMSQANQSNQGVLSLLQ